MMRREHVPSHASPLPLAGSGLGRGDGLSDFAHPSYSAAANTRAQTSNDPSQSHSKCLHAVLFLTIVSCMFLETQYETTIVRIVSECSYAKERLEYKWTL